MPALPYKIAVLVYLFDERGRVLLLHRRKPPNRDLYSPIGGKLEVDIGESPTACALREVQEEAGVTLAPSDLHLTGIISESGFAGEVHWLMFLYEGTRPVTVAAHQLEFDEGRLEWHAPDEIAKLDIPLTDRSVLWPLFWHYRNRFFCAHIDCSPGTLRWRIEQPATDVSEWHTVS